MPMEKFMQSSTWRNVVATGLLLCGTATAASAQDISDKSVEAFMEYAWSMTPAKFTKPNGSVVEINKKEREKVIVPVENAREIIRAGRMTAHAQLCELTELQVLNYRSLMKRESDKKKWSEQQLIYVNQLHLTTVMLLTGKIKLVEEEAGKKPVVEETVSTTKSCTDEQRKKVQELITAYLKTGPAVTLDGPAPAPATAAAPAAPVAPAAAPPTASPAAAKKP
jgi:hypothetical protein